MKVVEPYKFQNLAFLYSARGVVNKFHEGDMARECSLTRRQGFLVVFKYKSKWRMQTHSPNTKLCLDCEFFLLWACILLYLNLWRRLRWISVVSNDMLRF